MALTGDHVTMPVPSPTQLREQLNLTGVKGTRRAQSGTWQCHFARKNRERQGGGGRWWPQRLGPQGQPHQLRVVSAVLGARPCGASAARQQREGQESTGLSLATTVPGRGREETVWPSPPDARLLGQLSPRAANSQAPVHPTQRLSAQRSLWAQGPPGPHSWTRMLWLMPRCPRQLQLTPALRQSLQKIWSLVPFSSKPFNSCLQGEERGLTSKTVENLCWPRSSPTPAEGTHRAPTPQPSPSGHAQTQACICGSLAPANRTGPTLHEDSTTHRALPHPNTDPNLCTETPIHVFQEALQHPQHPTS